MFLNSGFSTEGEMDKVRFVGPIAPATNLVIPVNELMSLAALFAMEAEA